MGPAVGTPLPTYTRAGGKCCGGQQARPDSLRHAPDLAAAGPANPGSSYPAPPSLTSVWAGASGLEPEPAAPRAAWASPSVWRPASARALPISERVQLQGQGRDFLGDLPGPLPRTGAALAPRGRDHLLDQGGLALHRGPDGAQVPRLDPVPAERDDDPGGIQGLRPVLPSRGPDQPEVFQFGQVAIVDPGRVEQFPAAQRPAAAAARRDPPRRLRPRRRPAGP